MYTAFATVYDKLMGTVDYDAWAAHYRALTGLPAGSRCVECACGTGGLTLPLQRGGLKMTGVDLSEEMLAIAMQKAREAGLLIPFVHMDMCKLQVGKRVDGVLCTCDGINYLKTPQQVQAFLAAARQALRPGGVLAFDVSTPHKLKNVLGNNTLTHVDEGSAYIWQNAWSEKQSTVSMQLTIFVEEAGGYQRVEECQKQRAYHRDELKEWLTQAGFESIRCFGDQRTSPARETDARWHFVAAASID